MPIPTSSTLMWGACVAGNPAIVGELFGIGTALCEYLAEGRVVPVDVVKEVDLIPVIHHGGAIKNQNWNGFAEVDLIIILAGLHGPLNTSFVPPWIVT